jgi:murein tripeptide amidase MpaA
VRIKSSVRFSKDSASPQLFFEHGIDQANDKIYFAFTYPYTYTMLQNELEEVEAQHVNDLADKESIFYQRELITRSLDGRRVDLITISSPDGASENEREPLLSGLFPETKRVEDRPPVFREKEVVFVSARVHPGEVPAQHTFKGIFNLLMDPNDLRAKELRARYVFKLMPMLNPDGMLLAYYFCWFVLRGRFLR